MSIQSVIDYNLSQAGNFNYNITVHGEEGDILLPPHVNLHLFDCRPKKITAIEGDNAIFMARCMVEDIVEQANGSFIAEGCRFADEIIWRDSNRVQVKDTVFHARLKAWTNTHIDMYHCGCDISPKDSFFLQVQDHCRVNLSSFIITLRQKGVWATTGTVVEMVNMLLGGIETGIIADDNALVRMIGGQNLATKVGADIKNRSQVYYSKLSKPLIASDSHVTISDRSRFQAEMTNFSDTVDVAIKASDHSTVEFLNFDFLRSNGGNCVDLSDHSDALFITCRGDIKSNSGKAIYAKDNCRVRAVDVALIKSTGDDAVSIDETTKFIATAGKTIYSEGGVALRGNNDSTISLKKYEKVESQAAEAVNINDNTRAWFANTKLIHSIAGGSAIKAKTESDVSIQSCETIQGDTGHGIDASFNSTVQIQRLDLCEGKMGSGIKALTYTNVDVIYAENIEGKIGYGIDASDNCLVRVNRSTQVKGKVGGIRNITDGSLDLELLNMVLNDTGYSIECQTKVDTSLTLVDIIQRGIHVVDCDTKIKECGQVANPDGTAITVEQGQIDLRGVTAEGSTGSLALVYCSAFARNTTLNQSITSTGSNYDFEGVTVTGDITSSGDSIWLSRIDLSGGLNATGSGVNIEVGAIAGIISLVNSTLDIEKTTAANIALAASSIKSRLATGAALELAGASTADLMGSTFATIVLDPSSSALLANTSGVVSGGGTVISQIGGSITPGVTYIEMSPTSGIKCQTANLISIDINLLTILIDAMTGGGNVIISSTVATEVL